VSAERRTLSATAALARAAIFVMSALSRPSRLRFATLPRRFAMHTVNIAEASHAQAALICLH
jgi:hypothetical protein